MSKPTFTTTNTVYTSTPRTSDGTWNSSSAIFEMRDIAREEAKAVLDRELDPNLREFLHWVIGNDPHLSAKFVAFLACKRIGARTK